MTGIDQFIENNLGGSESIFDSCLNLIVYSYFSVEKQQKYSRAEILKIATIKRGKKIQQVELEDFLRNDLVAKHINPNRQLFGLNYYIFQSGAEEFSENIKTGILDIKVCSPLLNGDIYYIFECKRLNKKIIDNYVTEGVMRFVNNQYYPDNNSYLAGMISFLESQNLNEKIESSTAFSTIQTVFSKYNKELSINENLSSHTLICEDFKDIREFKYVYKSKHIKRGKNETIRIFHIVLDYNQLVGP